MSKISAGFTEYFSAFGDFTLPDPIPPRGNISHSGWSIIYIFTQDEQGKPCLDFWAEHRMTSPRHVRIDSEGNIIGLDSFLESYSYDPEVDKSEEDARKRFEEHNRKVGEVLKEKGFW